MTSEQMDQVLQAAAEGDAYVLLIAVKPARTAAEEARKFIAIAEEVKRTADRIRAIILGTACTPQPAALT